jgi:hypothetical protein
MQVYKRRDDVEQSEWEARSSAAVQRLQDLRAAFFESMRARAGIDLSMVAPDLFPRTAVESFVAPYAVAALANVDADDVR